MQISAVEAQIAELDFVASSRAEVQAVYDAYLAIDSAERAYVSNYFALSRLLPIVGIEYEEEEIRYNSGDAGIVIPEEYFDYTDQAAVNALPKNLTTAYRAEVLRLWNKINNSVDFEGKAEMTITLEKAKNEINAIQAEIDAIQAGIKEELYPFEWTGLKTRRGVRIVQPLYGAFGVRPCAVRTVRHGRAPQEQDASGQSAYGAHRRRMLCDCGGGNCRVCGCCISKNAGV